MQNAAFALGLDFGTDSVRAVVANAATGEVAGVGVAPYPRWATGLACDPAAHRFRQHPRDYLEAMTAAVRAALAQAGHAVTAAVRGLSACTTGSTPVLVDRSGQPLALVAGYEDDPDAMFVLWKDHTAVDEAEAINARARSWGGLDFTAFEGGVYSSEWFWAKALHIVRSGSPAGRIAASVVEHCDWIPAVLTGTTELARIKRSRCAAGHKAMWHPSFGGYPADEFLAGLHPRLVELKASLGSETYTADAPFGTLSPAWAARLGLPGNVAVGVGAFDAHMGAVGGGIRPHHLLKVMGTSTCDMLVAPRDGGSEHRVRGICGQVDGSILPGAIGYEAGQSAFGDVFAWFRDLLAWPLRSVLPAVLEPGPAARLAEAMVERILPSLDDAARGVAPDASGVLALDWLNGRRTPDADQRVKGAIARLDLGTDAPRIYRALVEATAFGARAIVDRLTAEGLRIDGAIAIGGVARKSPFIMQLVADVLELDIEIAAGEQPVALGAAMFAATAAGLHPRVEDAQRAMSAGTEVTFRPDPASAAHYRSLYDDYRALGAFVEDKLTTPNSRQEGS
ncbi:MAG TPA: ribulokinase [Kofleriaceae bacterium]|nr:ribulokinase [Kofleriaceae bacterium]